MICFAQLFVWPDCAQRSRAGYQLCYDWEQLIVLFYQFWQAWWIINWCFIETSLGKSINIASHRITRIIQTNDNNNKNGRSICQHEPQKMTQRINKCHDKKKNNAKIGIQTPNFQYMSRFAKHTSAMPEQKNKNPVQINNNESSRKRKPFTKQIDGIAIEKKTNRIRNQWR